MSRRLLIAAGAIAALAVGVAWFFANFERVPFKEPIAMSAEARLRPYLAAERFAVRMGLQSEEKRSLPELDALPPAGVLLLPAGRQAIASERLGRLIAWVERGGHLIVEAEFAGVADPLLDRLGVQRVAGQFPLKPIAIEVPGSERKLLVQLFGRQGLQPPEAKLRLRAGPSSALKLVSFTRGKGVVTAATALGFASNRVIGEHDHAEFLWVLMQLTDARRFDVFFRPERLSLWRFFTGHASEALMTGAALLGLWLWRVAPRFGPLAPDPPPVRRRLLDHLRASGRYFWASGLRERLVAAAREAALRRFTRVQPDFAGAPPAERAARLAAAIGISREAAARFLSARGAEHGAEFMVLIHHAQRVHAALEHGVLHEDVPNRENP